MSIFNVYNQGEWLGVVKAKNYYDAQDQAKARWPQLIGIKFLDIRLAM